MDAPGAHEGPHGPAITAGGKYGGQVVAVIALAPGHATTPPAVRYTAEGVRSEGQEVRVYFFDTDMKKLDLGPLPAKLDGNLESKWKGKHEGQAFVLEKGADYYKGTAPAPKRRPFNLEVQFKMGAEKFYAGLDNQV